jgi:hypothetical protein
MNSTSFMSQVNMPIPDKPANYTDTLNQLEMDMQMENIEYRPKEM